MLAVQPKKKKKNQCYVKSLIITEIKSRPLAKAASCWICCTTRFLISSDEADGAALDPKRGMAAVAGKPEARISIARQLETSENSCRALRLLDRDQSPAELLTALCGHIAYKRERSFYLQPVQVDSGFLHLACGTASCPSLFCALDFEQQQDLARRH